MRLMRYTTHLAQFLEEKSRKDEGQIGRCLKLWLYQSLCDRLWAPFKAVCFSPFITLSVVLVLYVVFCIIYAPLWFASLFVTQYGAYFLLFLVLNFIARTMARSIAFPGSNATVQKQMSSDFIRRVTVHLEALANLTCDFSATLLLGATGEVPLIQLPSSLEKRFNDVIVSAGTMSRLLRHMNEAVHFLASEAPRGTVSESELKIMKAFTKAIQGVMEALSAMEPLAYEYIIECNRKKNSSSGGGGGGGRSGRAPVTSPLIVLRGSSALIKSASHCLKAAEALKVAAVDARPSSTSDGELDDSSSVTSKINAVLSLNKGPEGSEKLAFPYMRALLKHRYAAEQFTIKGPHGNFINGIVLPAAGLPASGISDSTSSDLRTANVASGSGRGGGGDGLQKSAAAAGEGGVSPANRGKVERSGKGVVLYCSPNAGFYELLAHADINSSWMGVYMCMGYDVCLFNYRGYGLSTGAPHPRGVKKDAEQVYKFLQRDRQPPQIVLHGESIGGMVACHVARKYPVDLLVCDRTFASLESTAVRMLGSWAGLGLQYFALWSTDTVKDYLACPCPKIVLQDPADEIIHHVASLKNGVALRVILGDLDWKNSPEPRDYNYASYINAPVPHSSHEGVMLEIASDPSQRIPEAFITHLYGCLMDISKRATLASFPRARRLRQYNRQQQMQQQQMQLQMQSQVEMQQGQFQEPPSVGSGAENEDGPGCEMHHRGSGTFSSGISSNASLKYTRDTNASLHSGATATAGSGSLPSSSSSASAAAFPPHVMAPPGIAGDFSLSVGGDNDTARMGLIREVGTPHPCAAGSAGGGPDGGSAGPGSLLGSAGSTHDSSDTDDSSESGGNGDSFADSTRFSSKREWLEKFCSISIYDSPNADPRLICNPATKAWAVVARVDGGSGQLLGQAVSGGVDSVRAWVSALLLWSHHAGADYALPRGCTGLDAAVEDLAALTTKVHRNELQGITSIEFVRLALGCLSKRLQAHKPRSASHSSLLRGAATYQQGGSEPASATAMESGSLLQPRCSPAGTHLHLHVTAGGGSGSSSATTTGSSGSSLAAGMSAAGMGGVGGCTDLHLRDRLVGCVGGETGFLMQTVRSSESLTTLAEWLDALKPIASCQRLAHFLQRNFRDPYASLQTCSSSSTSAPMSPLSSTYGAAIGGSGGTNSAGGSGGEVGGGGGGMPYVGRIIPLHCGHNGWPSAAELRTFKAFIAEHGIQ